MAFSWDWAQRVPVSEKVVYVEWRRPPPTTWFYARGLTSFDLDVSSTSSHTLRLCHAIESHMHQLRPGHQLCVSVRTSTDPGVRTRAVCVLACFHLLHHHTATATDAWIPFGSLHTVPFFDRFSSLHVIDCVRGLEKARAAGFLAHDHVSTAPFTWLSKKLVTFPGPSAQCSLETFLPYFQAHNVTLILALFPPVYTFDTLLGAIEYMDLSDTASCDVLPSDEATLARILDAIESSPGAVAVHGLHRARTFLGGYLVRCHGFSAAEAAGWLHVAHPPEDLPPCGQARDPIFPHVLRRWQRCLVHDGDRGGGSRCASRDGDDQRPTSSSSLKINIGGISFGSSLLLGSSTAKTHDKSSSKKRVLTPGRSKEVSDLGGTTSRGHSRERTIKTPATVQS